MKNSIEFKMSQMPQLAEFLTNLTACGAAYSVANDGITFRVTITGA